MAVSLIYFTLVDTIELGREVDGRWIAEVPELNVLLYGGFKAGRCQESSIDRAGDYSRPGRAR
jgi:hypothetical protein